MTQQLHIRLRSEDGAYWATVDEFPGLHATGDTLEELRESVSEGISLLLAKPGEDAPTVTLGELRTPPEQVATAELVYA